MANFSHKNIIKILQDIRHPKKGANLAALLGVKREDPASRELPQVSVVKPESKIFSLASNALQGRLLRSFLKATAVILVLGISLSLLDVLVFRHLATGKIKSIYQETLKGKDFLAEFKPREAGNSFFLASQETVLVSQWARNSGMNWLAQAVSGIAPQAKTIPALLNNLAGFNSLNFLISKEFAFLTENGLHLAFNNGGAQIIQSLESLDKHLGSLIGLSGTIRDQIGSLGTLSSGAANLAGAFNKNYLSASVDFYKARDWLASLLALLKSSEERHFLLIFQNPSEMRPAGGFIGSFADLTVQNGDVKKINVDDIYNADRQMPLKVIPPRQLQPITRSWGARDANWFFDFPTSAEKVIYFLENSDLYRGRKVKFLGAAAINVNIIKSLLAATGPIELPQYRLTLNSENFLKEVQYEVEAGRDKKPGQNPKKILSVITPLLLDKLANLSDQSRAAIAESLKNHLEQKDAMFYFKDFGLEDLAMRFGVAGEMMELPSDFSGDYLAVVNANIASGKTDAFIGQKIILESEIGGDGTVHNRLSVERSHSGQNESDWWYRADNKSFIKILAPRGAQLIGIKNNYYPNFGLAGYDSSFRKDPDLSALENSRLIKKLGTEAGEEMGRAYFATWLKVKAGEKNTLELIYDNPLRFLPQDGLSYKFIFEKQSGVKSSLEYAVTAPLGYVWKESNSAIFRYFADSPKAREIISLTLIRQ